MLYLFFSTSLRTWLQVRSRSVNEDGGTVGGSWAAFVKALRPTELGGVGQTIAARVGGRPFRRSNCKPSIFSSQFSRFIAERTCGERSRLHFVFLIFMTMRLTASVSYVYLDLAIKSWARHVCHHDAVGTRVLEQESLPKLHFCKRDIIQFCVVNAVQTYRNTEPVKNTNNLRRGRMVCTWHNWTLASLPR